jgi:cell fate regulator YaaT (PSP1 superfamily)
MIGIGKIKFKEPGKLHTFQAEGLKLEPGDSCVVRTDIGLKLGEVVVGPKHISLERKCTANLMKAVRKATRGDIRRQEELLKLEDEAFKVCENKIEERELPMKLIGVEAVFDKSKVLFYFRSETRVDFRELVKDLAHQFRTRIELRQIGVRDEARIVGGMGCCGRTLCCSTFLREFKPVSIKMAKKQNLALNPTKISGQCGRLMCCIQYEYGVYVEADQKRKAEAKKSQAADKREDGGKPGDGDRSREGGKPKDSDRAKNAGKPRESGKPKDGDRPREGGRSKDGGRSRNSGRSRNDNRSQRPRGGDRQRNAQKGGEAGGAKPQDNKPRDNRPRDAKPQDSRPPQENKTEGSRPVDNKASEDKKEE